MREEEKDGDREEVVREETSIGLVECKRVMAKIDPLFYTQPVEPRGVQTGECFNAPTAPVQNGPERSTYLHCTHLIDACTTVSLQTGPNICIILVS